MIVEISKQNCSVLQPAHTHPAGGGGGGGVGVLYSYHVGRLKEF
jgi:hypothetical protein